MQTVSSLPPLLWPVGGGDERERASGGGEHTCAFILFVLNACSSLVCSAGVVYVEGGTCTV